MRGQGYLGVLLVLLVAAAAQAADPAPPLAIEINKTEDVDNACRVYVTFENRSDSSFAALRLDLVVFGRDGVIARRLALEGAPLPSGKTSVKLFDIQGAACGDLGRILLNDILACRDAGGDRQNCTDLVNPASRAKIAFVK